MKVFSFIERKIMPGRRTHMLAGETAGVVVYGVIKRLKKEEWTLGGVLIAIVYGTLGGMLPDILEPAISSHHRQFCHSLLIAGIAYWGRDKFYKVLNLTFEQTEACNSFLIGYASHLVLDSATPRSIPLGGKICIN